MDMSKYALSTVILAAGLMGGSYLLSKFQLNLKKEELSRGYIVKGYASKTAVADIGLCRVNLKASAPTVAECYAKLENARTALHETFQKAGFPEKEIEVFAVSTDEVNKRDEKGNFTNTVDYYTMSQSFTVTSPDVQKIAAFPAVAAELYKQGVQLSLQRPEFYVSDLDRIKDETLAAATLNARQRALTLAENGGGKIGLLRRASQGVFQVTEPLSTDISDYGEYNTATIEKAVKAVVSVEYQLAE